MKIQCRRSQLSSGASETLSICGSDKWSKYPWPIWHPVCAALTPSYPRCCRSLDGIGLTALPSAAANLRSLQRLILAHNMLHSLPDEIGDLPYLQELSVG